MGRDGARGGIDPRRRHPHRASSPCPACCTTCARRSTRWRSARLRSASSPQGRARWPITGSSGSIPTCRSPIRSTADGRRCSPATSAATADGLGADGAAYRRLFGPLVDAGFDLTDGLLSPFAIPPRHPLTLRALRRHRHPRRGRGRPPAVRDRRGAGTVRRPVRPLDPAARQAGDRRLRTDARRARPPRRMAARPRRLAADHRRPRRSARRTRAARSRVTRRSRRWPSCRPPTPSCSTSPRASWSSIAGDAVPQRYRRSLTRFRYGPGVFKVDWALDGPIPWTNPQCRTRGDRPPRRHARRDRRRRGRRRTPAATPSGRSSCSPSRRCSTPIAPRPARTRPGRTATCRTDRRST